MSATQEIKKLLERGEAISPVEALAVFGVIRLGGIIFKLRKDGMLIETTMRTDSKGHNYGRYSLKKVTENSYRFNGIPKGSTGMSGTSKTTPLIKGNVYVAEEFSDYNDPGLEEDAYFKYAVGEGEYEELRHFTKL